MSNDNGYLVEVKDLKEQRYQKFRKMGVFLGQNNGQLLRITN